jgi:hypothetical protein
VSVYRPLPTRDELLYRLEERGVSRRALSSDEQGEMSVVIIDWYQRPVRVLLMVHNDWRFVVSWEWNS